MSELIIQCIYEDKKKQILFLKQKDYYLLTS